LLLWLQTFTLDLALDALLHVRSGRVTGKKEEGLVLRPCAVLRADPA
jgi:hypothetical protein